MLTPVTPNPIAQSTTIKSHGSESRTAPGHNAVDSQNLPQTTNHSAGVGLDAGTILANVNAEAATAGNRTILQTLALAVAAQLNLVRHENETMEAFFLRIAAALDDMAPDERAAIELKAGLKLLKIQLPELSAALKQPESALAARLSAMAEAPQATPQKTAAATATTNYLQEAPGVSRAAETLAMVTQVRTHADGNGIFSSAPAPSQPEKQPADARGLQAQLKSLFEPGVAETRVEIAAKVEQPNVLILGGADDIAEPAARPEKLASAPVAEPAQVDIPEQATVSAENQLDGLPAAKQSDAQPAEARQSEARQPDARQTEIKDTDAKHPDPRPTDGSPAENEPVVARAADARDADVVRSPQAEVARSNMEQPLVRQAELKPAESRLPAPDKAGADATALPEITAPAPIEERIEPKRISLPIPQNNNNYATANSLLRAIARELVREKMDEKPAAVDRRGDGDHRMQTMLTLKGIAEVITTMPAKAAEFLMSPQLVADIKAKEAKNSAAAGRPQDASVRSDDGGASDKAEVAGHRDLATARQPALPAPARDNEAEQMRLPVNRPANEEPPAGRMGETTKAMVASGQSGRLDPVPFAFAALQPAKEEFEAERIEEHGRQQDENEDAEEQPREDPEARRERLARKATDDLLRPESEAEPEVKITRDSSQADRAYALYQRMAGF